MADEQTPAKTKGRPKKTFDPKAYDRVRDDILQGKITLISDLLEQSQLSARQLAKDSGIGYKRVQTIKARPGEVMALELKAIGEAIHLQPEQVLKLFLNEIARLSK